MNYEEREQTEEGQRMIEQHRKALKISLEDVQAQDLQDKTAALKALRVTINTAISEAKRVAAGFMHGAGVDELTNSIDCLRVARMWAGEALGELGHKLPAEYRDEAKQ